MPLNAPYIYSEVVTLPSGYKTLALFTYDRNNKKHIIEYRVCEQNPNKKGHFKCIRQDDKKTTRKRNKIAKKIGINPRTNQPVRKEHNSSFLRGSGTDHGASFKSVENKYNNYNTREGIQRKLDELESAERIRVNSVKDYGLKTERLRDLLRYGPHSYPPLPEPTISIADRIRRIAPEILGPPSYYSHFVGRD